MEKKNTHSQETPAVYKTPSYRAALAAIITTPFQTIPTASKTTGLSKYYLREGCKAGTIPHVMSGTTYYVNVPALLKQLGVE